MGEKEKWPIEKSYHGIVSFDRYVDFTAKEAEIGIRIESDGRIWVCVDGESIFRAKPFSSNQI